MKVPLTDRFCDRAKPGAEYFDERVSGLALRVVSKRKTWDLHFTYDDRRVRMPLGTYPSLSLAAARARALEAKSDLAEGNDPRQRQPETLKAISEEYLRRSILRSRDWQAKALARLVYPALGARPISDIRRTDIIRLLDTIEDENGSGMANSVLAAVRRIMNWHASRSDEFRSPIVRGMGRAKGRARDRILTDDEIRALWNGTADGGFGRYLRFLLLTGARRTEATGMTWTELDGADWTLPAARNKTKIDLIRPLSKLALATLPERHGELVFGMARGTIGQRKKEFDKAVLMAHWTLHDLRRTARSLMSRAGVPTDHAERCLGHVIGGVRGVYDRYEYREEKARAFEALAAQIARIVDPQANIVPIRR
jgi:integrase